MRGDIIGYVFARKKAFPLRSFGEIGVDACMAAKAVGVSQVYDVVLMVFAECRCSTSSCVRCMLYRCKRAA